VIVFIRGVLVDRGPNRVVVDVNGIGHEVLIPTAVEQRLGHAVEGEPISLLTMHYLQMDQSRATPVLIGFVDAMERDFFERLLTVPKVGPKLALAMFALPVAEMALAIERGDTARLRALPGVGAQKARDLVSTLQGKLAEFLSAEPADTEHEAAPARSELEEEVLQILVDLGHRKQEAARMIADALRENPELSDVQSLVAAVYGRQRRVRLATP